MAGEQPAARRTLAMMSMDTKLVMQCTSGAMLRTLCHSCHALLPVGARSMLPGAVAKSLHYRRLSPGWHRMARMARGCRGAQGEVRGTA